MTTAYTIHLTPHVSAEQRQAGGTPRTRVRWRAELIQAGVGSRGGVEGHETPDGALGALVRWVVGECTSPDDVLDFVASLFGDTTYLDPDIQLGRAIRLAARHPKREHPGCVVTIGDPAEALVTPAKRPKALAAKGGSL